MARIKRSVHAKKKRRKILERARGYKGARSRRVRTANEQVMHAMQDAYRDRRARKRDMRSLWIIRITAACRMRGTRYSLFLSGLRNAGIILNRKMLSQIAIEDPGLFDELVKIAAEATAATPAK